MALPSAHSNRNWNLKLYVIFGLLHAPASSGFENNADRNSGFTQKISTRVIGCVAPVLRSSTMSNNVFIINTEFVSTVIYQLPNLIALT